ncbi:MAG TPA: hypothetical protein VJN18_11770 [Polyangiaceae bacterium]|nr:hypothetical protein [Polyangiaceae bacterium]
MSIARAGPVVAALAASLSLAPAAVGQGASTTEREKVRLLYEAPESCAERDQFLPQVRARLGTDWEAVPGELARTIHVKVTLAGDRYVARIELQDARGKQVARAVAGTRCEQVIEGIALVTVLAIQAQLEELIGQSEPAADDTSPPAKPSGVAAAPAPATPAGRAPVRNRAHASPTQVKVRIAGRGLVQQGVGPEVALGYGALAALAWPQWTLQLAVDTAATGRVDAGVVPAHFDLLAVRLDACGRFELLTPNVSIEPGIFFQMGVLEAQGYESLPTVTRGSGGTTKWLAPGLLLALRAELAQVFLGLEVAAGVPLDQEQFYLAEGDRKTKVYGVPRLSTSAALAVGVVF